MCGSGSKTVTKATQPKYKYELGNPWDERRGWQSPDATGEGVETDLGGPVTLKTGGNVARRYGDRVQIKPKVQRQGANPEYDPVTQRRVAPQVTYVGGKPVRVSNTNSAYLGR